jgi:hypothetical protein
MFASIASRRICAMLLALCAFAPASAAPIAAGQDSSASIALLHPLELIKREDLDFGYVGVGATAGTVVINPNTGAITRTGGAFLLGGTPHPAMFTGAAGSSSVVIIRIPKQPITLTRVAGTETMTVSNFTLEGLDKRQAARNVSFDFRVGGTLNVNANQREGVYVGTFEVSVQYP